jgi:hypothetical protein
MLLTHWCNLPEDGDYAETCSGKLILKHAVYIKGKAIPLQPLTGPEGSSRLRLPDFMTIGT